MDYVEEALDVRDAIREHDRRLAARLRGEACAQSGAIAVTLRAIADTLDNLELDPPNELEAFEEIREAENPADGTVDL